MIRDNMHSLLSVFNVGAKFCAMNMKNFVLDSNKDTLSTK